MSKAVSLKAAVQDLGVQIADGALDLIKIAPNGSEAYHVELAQGERFRFSLVANRLIHVQVSSERSPGIPAPPPPAKYAGIDQYSFELRSTQNDHFLVVLRNGAGTPADVAVFFRTLTPGS